MEINSILLAFLLTMIAGLSTGVGSLIAFFAKRTNTKFLSAALGFSAGVMIYISFMELMPEALGMLSENFSPRMSNIYMLIAFFSGTSFIALIDFLIPEDENPHEVHRVEELSGQQRLHRTGILMALAISIHNFPEGLATQEDSAVFLYGFIQSRKHGNKFYTLGISPHDDSRPIDRSGKPHCIFRQANQYEISFCGIGVLGRSNDIYIVHGIDARGIGYAQREFQPAHV